MHLSRFLCGGFFLLAAHAQTSTLSDGNVLTLSGSASGISDATLPTGNYISYSTTLTVTATSKSTGAFGSISNSASSIGDSNSTSSTVTTPTASRTYLQGSQSPSTATATNATTSDNATSSSTSSSAQPTNTTPCNNYAEFCHRKYSNITMISAHNSPFHVKGNAGSNQAFDVTTQLNDGIRFVQAQAHIVNGTVYLCHSSCDMLNAGTLTDWLTTVTSWVRSHPYDVITILIGNAKYNKVTEYLDPITASGIGQFAFTPPKIPMALDDWPTLASMILSGQRVVMFMDYEADQTKVPWILDEFSQIWETPFDPTDRSFPCTVQRPPALSAADAKNRLYMANHNLNTQVTLLGNTLLLPTTTLLNITNNVTGTGSLGVTAEQCNQTWGRAPNFLNVDYYNVGSGSVFQVAAKWNNVTYNRTCCGFATSDAKRTMEIVGRGWLVAALLAVLASWLIM